LTAIFKALSCKTRQPYARVAPPPLQEATLAQLPHCNLQSTELRNTMECAQARKGEKKNNNNNNNNNNAQHQFYAQTSDRDPTMTPNRLAPVAQQTSLEQAGLPAQLEVEDVKTHMQNVSKIRKLQMQKPFLRVRLRSKRIEQVEVEDVRNE